MKKIEVIKNALKEEMTNQDLMKAVESLPFTVKVCVSKKEKNVVNIYDASGKTKMFSVKIVEAKKEKKATKKAAKKAVKIDKDELRKSCDSVPVKEKGNGYVVFWKMKDNEKIFSDDTMTTCTEIKAFIKKIHNIGKLESINIYKMGANYFEDMKDIHKTRISAWKGIITIA